MSLRQIFLTWTLLLFAVQGHAQYLRIYYPDIEQGSATLVVSPTGNAVLIDAGTGLNATEIGIEDFINDLIAAGVVTNLQATIATHYDEDHIGRFENVFQYVPLATGFVAYDRGTFLSTPTTFAYSDYSYYAGLNNRTTITANTTINLGGGVLITCYVVNGVLPDGTSVDLTSAAQFENAASAAVVVHYGDVDVWIGGDLTDNPADGHPAVESAVAPFVGDLDVYTVNHHGSRTTSSNPTFLSTIKAEIAINQNSSDNSHGHPTLDIVNRIHATNDTFGNTPVFLQTNPGDPDDTRSDDALSDGIADPDDINGSLGLPGAITLISDGESYQVYGGMIEPLRRLADEGTPTMGDFPPAILRISHNPVVPTAIETVTVTAQIRDEGSITAFLDLSLNGVVQTPITMTEVVTGRFEATIPAQPDGTAVTFRVRALDSGARVARSRLQGYFSGTTNISLIRDQDSDEVLLTKGFVARVRGNISAEPGLFHDFVSQLYVQDSTSGINIFDATLLPLDRGDDTTFIGKVDQYSGAAQIVIAEDFGNFGFTDHGTGSAPTPQVVTVANLNETVEGRLIRINNVEITSGTIPGSGNGNLTISDDGGVSTTTLRVDGDTNIPGANTPTGAFDIIGVAGQFDSSLPLNSGYQVLPRERTDFITAEVNHPDVLIGEIHADPDAVNGDANGDGTVSSSHDEFVEVVNTTLSEQDISNWQIHDNTGLRFTFPANTLLPPREAAVVFGGGNPTGDFGNAASNGLVFTSTLGLNNSGDTITLKDNLGVAVQAVTYGGEGGDNQSLVRDPDWSNAPFVKHTTTAAGARYSPGTRIDGSAYTLQAGALLLSEVMYDPTSSDGGSEWIELYNATGNTIDLTGTSIAYGGTAIHLNAFNLSGSVAAGQTFVIGGPDSDGDNANPTYDLVHTFSPGLQNSGSPGDGVALYNVDASLVSAAVTPIDAVIYGNNNNNNLIDESGSASANADVGDAPSGSTIERVDTAGTWQVQNSPTPNSTTMTTGGTTYGPASDVILSEVFYDVTGGDNGWEWIELYNKGSNPVDLSGLSIGSGGSDLTSTTAQLSGIIQPGTTFVVGGPNTSGSNGNPTIDLAINFSPDLQNSGSPSDAVALFDVLAGAITGSTVPIDCVVYGPNNPAAFNCSGGPHVGDVSAGRSIERTSLAGAWAGRTSPDPNNVNF